jgi:hypothetical protein
MEQKNESRNLDSKIQGQLIIHTHKCQGNSTRKGWFSQEMVLKQLDT